MNASIRVNTLRRTLPIALAMAALAVVSARAHAADADSIDQVTISAPAVTVVGRDAASAAPIEESTVTARVTVDPITLTTNSGVALLKDSVLKAAREACDAADPYTPDDGTCVFGALKMAQPQVDAVIARARNSVNG
jgi:UrcA family protein